jgi:hypothetical protein
VSTPLTQGREETFDWFVVRSSVLVKNGGVDWSFSLLGDDFVERGIGVEIVPGIVGSWIVRVYWRHLFEV